jgi:hypothetical protein
VTDALGAYSATVAVDFSGTVTPILAGYAFDPASRTYTNLPTNQTAQDYTATLLTYTISGRVTLDSAGLAGVTMAGLPGNPVTDGTGFYQAAVSHGTSFTVTPTHRLYIRAGLQNLPRSRVTSLGLRRDTDRRPDDRSRLLAGGALVGLLVS